MPQRRNRNLTRLDIIRTATALFLEKGYSATSPNMIRDVLGISLGSLTYYFPTKEDLLTVLIEMLADFQWRIVREPGEAGDNVVLALCLELAAMVSISEEDEVARDLYLSAYTNAKPLACIRKSDAARAKSVFASYCSDWTDEMFAAAENLVTGIEYATMCVTPDSPPIETRIYGALDTILGFYRVSEEERRETIAVALSMDYHGFGREMLADFRQYVNESTERQLIALALHPDSVE